MRRLGRAVRPYFVAAIIRVVVALSDGVNKVFMTSKHTWREILRVRWALIISLAVLYGRRVGWLPPEDQITVIAQKLSYVTLAFVLIHILRQQAFGYADMGTMLRENSPYFGQVWIGNMILYGLVVVAVALSL